MGKVYSGRARRGIARMAVVALLAGSATFLLHGVAAAAVNCDSVFQGETPSDPIIKTADKTQAYAGQTVTFTLTFKSTGTGDNVTADCYRVDDGSNNTLNALVTGFNSEKTNANVGPDGTEQHVTYTITVPSDTSLIGHKIVDRAKATSGSVESRSDLIEVSIVAPPCTENCNPQPSPTPTPTPTPTVSGTQAPTPKPSTSVKGVTLGKTGSSTGSVLWFGILFILLGAALSRVKAVRSLVPAVSTRVRRARHTKR